MDNNQVHLIGHVKRNTDSGGGVLDFTLEVLGEDGRMNFFDIRTTTHYEAYHQMDGVANEGEYMEVFGHLERMTRSDKQRMGFALVEVRATQTIVVADSVEFEKGQQ